MARGFFAGLSRKVRGGQATRHIAPADDGAVAPHPAGAPPTLRRTPGRRSLAVLIAAPAGDGVVAPHPAGVVIPGAHGGEGTRGWRGLTIPIVAPAGD